VIAAILLFLIFLALVFVGVSIRRVEREMRLIRGELPKMGDASDPVVVDKVKDEIMSGLEEEGDSEPENSGFLSALDAELARNG
jgi:hypothetical protein